MVDVVVLVMVFCTPRICMHMCLLVAVEKKSKNKAENIVVFPIVSFLPFPSTHLASTMTAQPVGFSTSMMVDAICLVSRSCTTIHQ